MHCEEDVLADTAMGRSIVMEISRENYKERCHGKNNCKLDNTEDNQLYIPRWKVIRQSICIDPCGSTKYLKVLNEIKGAIANTSIIQMTKKMIVRRCFMAGRSYCESKHCLDEMIIIHFVIFI